ncbi:bifunctional (p)ppGpp synthetase/guanosine-3',5'-bis(diphosphate) 3'-pyrophosphohydrolase [Mobiluncus sp.]|uniref:RelA/SpoT family protein n=1 Tax=Mobiluncus sp. TaxID=47293 RepID=UPI002A9143DC|nr:bifunctional (p)ppGpp synthetase/guanosine-3',5'-bis(diphosphate) 3'-pyrophosphohydrolase [Mobiluncus sp.]MDY6076684.1 bifunctional (p)ppGpp synthetase/guanosine-3',5'-bis(diphosphate) 3'-pyrophosphohydrolase [Mobiluncus sp.]
MEQAPEIVNEPSENTGALRGSLFRLVRSRSSYRELEPVLRAVKENHPKADFDLLERAYVTAERYHQGQFRKSGEPYITHPVAVATILAELGMSETTVAAGLLHDTVEDTDYSLEQCRRDFGEDIAALVDGVTKLDKVKYGDSAPAETIRKMLVAMAKDIRVLLIKLSDRLHNARTWRYVSKESAARKAKETLEIYAPLAHRMGLNAIKWELEDLAFKTLYPQIYQEIDKLIQEAAPRREEQLSAIIQTIEGDLRDAKIKGTVTGRPKHHYSIYQKMIVRGRDFNDIYDLVAVRVLVESVRDCYAVLGLMHSRWSPMLGRFKDYIAMPKYNLYQSLHTTVIGPKGKPVEIQIRTYEMHRRAEFGIAAHWKYKENPNAKSLKKSEGGKVLDLENEMGWLRQLVDWQKQTQDSGEFLDSLRYEINSAQVYVFTPKGQVVVLAAGSTPVDFAYSVHTEVGNKTVGAKVNGKLVPLESKLENGDTVEIFTSKSPGASPSRDWLSFVATPRAKSKIKAWFSKERREESIDKGREILAKEIRKQKLPIHQLASHEFLESVAKQLGLPNVDTLYATIGDSHVSAQNVVERLLSFTGSLAEDDDEEVLSEEEAVPTHTPTTESRAGGSGVLVDGQDADDLWVKLAKCCTPVPGDEIMGFVTRGHGVSVHRVDCVNAKNLSVAQQERVISVKWAQHSKTPFLVQVQIEALDRGGLLSDVTRVLTDNHVNILSGNISTTRDRVAYSRWAFELAEPSHLQDILNDLGRISGVYSATRVTPGQNVAAEPTPQP